MLKLVVKVSVFYWESLLTRKEMNYYELGYLDVVKSSVTVKVMINDIFRYVEK